MNETIKVVIPMAGLGTRLRPLTLSKPKQLIRIADNTMLGHVLASLESLPFRNVEYVFILGYLGDRIKTYMQEQYPALSVRYVEQTELKGQSHALYQAREILEGRMLMVFADTLIETDLSFLRDETADGVAWVQDVPDPRQFGIAVANAHGEVVKIVEKPANMENRRAVVGFYYFADSQALMRAIETQLSGDGQLKGEYFLADAINILLGAGFRMRVEPVKAWLDAGTPQNTLMTNQYLLENGRDNTRIAVQRHGAQIIGPVYVHPDAVIENALIGPNVSIGAGCRISRSIVRDSIIEDGAEVANSVMQNSMLGRQTRVQGRVLEILLSDHSEIESA